MGSIQRKGNKIPTPAGMVRRFIYQIFIMSHTKKQFRFDVGETYSLQIASLPPKERDDNMQGIAYKVEDTKYTKPLSDEELAERKTEHSDVSIKLFDLAERKKEIMAEFKKEMKDLDTQAKELLQSIRFKSEKRQGVVYSLDDQEAGVMYEFDGECVCINIRTLTKAERQTAIKYLNKVENDNDDHNEAI